jgi:hypothetical protein
MGDAVAYVHLRTFNLAVSAWSLDIKLALPPINRAAARARPNHCSALIDGIIQPQGGGKDVFVHISAVREGGLEHSQ